MYRYTAYGFGIHSELLFPELLPAEANADVTIRVDHLNHLPMSTGAGTFSVTANAASVRYAGIGAVLIRGGSEIIVDPEPDVDEAELRFYILGAAFGVLLHQRGRLVLHASAASIDGKAIAFLGAPGSGKSTTAAAFYARGHNVVADDLVAIAFDDASKASVPIIYPGFPVLKLSPEAAAALGDDISTSPRTSSNIDKRARHIDRGFSTAPLSLQRVYVLAEGERPEIKPLTPQESFVELVRHTFVVHLLDVTETTSTHFRQCSIVADSVPVRLLKRPQSLDALPAVAELVERDIRFIVQRM